MSDEDVFKCAQAGDTEAQFEIGVRKISSGGGSKEEVASGLRWLERAAIYNHLEAQLALAYLFLQGKTVPRNETQGIRWAKEAVANGSEEAADLLLVFRDEAAEDDGGAVGDRDCGEEAFRGDDRH